MLKIRDFYVVSAQLEHELELDLCHNRASCPMCFAKYTLWPITSVCLVLSCLTSNNVAGHAIVYTHSSSPLPGAASENVRAGPPAKRASGRDR